jgi:hypothetical protein
MFTESFAFAELSKAFLLPCDDLLLDLTGALRGFTDSLSRPFGVPGDHERASLSNCLLERNDSFEVVIGDKALELEIANLKSIYVLWRRLFQFFEDRLPDSVLREGQCGFAADCRRTVVEDGLVGCDDARPLMSGHSVLGGRRGGNEAQTAEYAEHSCDDWDRAMIAH